MDGTQAVEMGGLGHRMEQGGTDDTGGAKQLTERQGAVAEEDTGDMKRVVRRRYLRSTKRPSLPISLKRKSVCLRSRAVKAAT